MKQTIPMLLLGLFSINGSAQTVGAKFSSLHLPFEVSEEMEREAAAKNVKTERFYLSFEFDEKCGIAKLEIQKLGELKSVAPNFDKQKDKIRAFLRLNYECVPGKKILYTFPVTIGFDP